MISAAEAIEMFVAENLGGENFTNDSEFNRLVLEVEKKRPRCNWLRGAPSRSSILRTRDYLNRMTMFLGEKYVPPVSSQWAKIRDRMRREDERMNAWFAELEQSRREAKESRT